MRHMTIEIIIHTCKQARVCGAHKGGRDGGRERGEREREGRGRGQTDRQRLLLVESYVLVVAGLIYFLCTGK